MALSKNTGDGFQTIILKLISKENGQTIPATLKALRKQGEDGKYQEFDRFTKINGKISKIELKTDSIPQSNGINMEIEKVKIIFRDDEVRERYVLDLNYTNVTRSLFNSVLGLKGTTDKYGKKSFSNIEFSFYQNKKGYNSVYVTENNESVSWAFGLDVIPKAKKFVINKKEQTDYSEVDDFYKEKLMEFIDNNTEFLSEQSDSDVESSTQTHEAHENEVDTKPTHQSKNEPVLAEVEGVDDLPF